MVKSKYSREAGEVQLAGRQVMGGYPGRVAGQDHVSDTRL